MKSQKSCRYELSQGTNICRLSEGSFAARIYLLIVNNKNTKKGWNMLTIKKSETCSRSRVYIANFEDISHLFLVFLLLTSIR